MVRESFPWARLVQERNRGYSAACNAGVRAGDSDFVLLLNSDTEMLPATLTMLVEALEAHPRAGALCPTIVDGKREIQQMSWGWQPLFLGEILQRFFVPRALAAQPWRLRIVHALERRERTAAILCGAAMIFRRAVLAAIGGMDEGYVFYLEDSDVCTRVWKAGWQCVYDPRTQIVHHLGKSSAERPDRMSLLYRQSQLRYYRRHGTMLDRFLLGVYLRARFWRIYHPPREPAAGAFYRQLRAVLENRAAIDLT